MNTTTLKDNKNHTIGYIESDNAGNQTLKNTSHHTLGFYDAANNITRNAQHHVVGHGNLLSTLLVH